MILANYSDVLPQTMRLYLLSCTHVGDLACHRKGMEKMVDVIKKDRNAYWGHLGDSVGAIFYLDPRYDVDMHAGKHQTANAQARDFAKIFHPIAGKMLFLLDGNHDNKLIKTVDIPYQIREKFVDKYEKDISMMKYGSVEISAQITENCKIYCCHGAGLTNSRAEDRQRRYFNDCDSVRKKLVDQAGDCHGAFMGHIHKLRVRKPSNPLHIVSNKKKLQQMYPTAQDFKGVPIVPEQYRWYGSVGSFLKTKLVTPERLMEGQRFDTYSAKKLYSTVELGCLRLDIKQGWLANVEEVKI